MDETRSDRSVLKDVVRSIAAKEGVEDTPRFRIFAEDTSAPLLELSKGSWIVLEAAVWSTYDIDSVAVAAKLLSKVPSTVSIGVRLFGRFEEIAALFDSIDVERDIHGVTPVWIFVKDGNVERFYLGPHLGEEGEKRLYRRVLGWLHGEPKESPPSDLARLVRWGRSLWNRKQN